MKRIGGLPWLWGLAMLAAVVLGELLAPRHSMRPAGSVDLEATIPKRFGDWTFVPTPFVQVDLAVRRDDQDESAQVYDQVLMRTYRNAAGDSVMLALAWGRQQRQEVKIHRPELCYTAQGFRIESNRPIDALGDGTIEGRAMLAASTRRLEPVVYWVRIGDTVSRNAWQTRWYILREGVAGRIPDGILVRTSQVVRSADRKEASVALQQRFLADLLAALPPAQRALLAPTDPQRLATAR
jgi:EpsI family protein